MCAIFVALGAPLMGAGRGSVTSHDEGWTIQTAEELLTSLSGVVSARLVAKPGGEIEEIHVLTTEEVGAKQTVRNVESALLAHFDLEVDHRKISVARSDATVSDDGTHSLTEVLEAVPGRSGEARILFSGQSVEAEAPHRSRVRVSIEWKGERYSATAECADLPRPRLEAAAQATLRAVEKAVRGGESAQEYGMEPDGFTLALDGVKTMDAFERGYVLVAVAALSGRRVTALAGAGTVDDSPERAVVLATLQAVDRWVRGRSD